MRSITQGYRKPAILLVLAGILALVPTLTLARPGDRGMGPRMHGHGPGMGMERMLDRLDLTDSQREQIGELVAAHREQAAAERERIEVARGALFDQVHAADFDEVAIRDAAAAVAVVESDLAVARALHLQQFRAILTPEQQAELREMFEERRSFMEEGPGGGFPGHRPRLHGHGSGPGGF